MTTAQHAASSRVRPLFLRGNVWGALALLIVALGSCASVIEANAISHQKTQSSLKDSQITSAQIAETLQLSLQHEGDLVVGAESFELGSPNAKQASFVQWTKNEKAMARFPELFGVGAIQVVPRADIASFVARYPIASMPETRQGSTIAVDPPGVRPFYCLVTMFVLRNPRLELPRGFDICRAVPGMSLQRTQFSGAASLAPATFLGVKLLSISVPLYRGGAVPQTIADRKQAFVGFIGVLLNPSVDISAALVGHPNAEVALQYGGPMSAVLFHGGDAPQGAHVNSANLHNGWTVVVSATTFNKGILGDDEALLLLLGGFAVSFLLGGLLFLLGTGRARAIRMVHERTEELRFLALHDPLTGQPNRTLVLDRTSQMLARARRNHVPSALFFLDLDDFKEINDSLGHRAGDQVLIAVAARLETELREGDTVGRLGGDEFILLVEGDPLRNGVHVVAERILNALRAPFHIEESDAPVTVTASIGVATGDRSTPDELLRDADTAMYRAKARGKRCAVVFSQEMQDAAEDHRSLAVDLGRALEADEFFLVYQPTIDLQSSALTGVEALLRWRHPRRGIVEPADFIPELETSGLIVPVGTWVLNTACRQGALWHDSGHRLDVSVNVSVLQLARPEFVREVQQALATSGFDASKLTLEFTESTLMRDGIDTVARLQALKSMGVRLAVDDFGTGYSSLAYLRQFPMDIVKIDRSFIAGLSTSSEASALVHALVQLGKALNLQTVAEGIEDDDQRLHLQVEDVDIGQGFLFSVPLEVKDADAFLARYSSITLLPMSAAQWP